MKKGTTLKFLVKEIQTTKYEATIVKQGDELFSLCHDPDIKNIIAKISACSDEVKQRELKGQLPSFFPSIDPDNKTAKGSNGVFQFDIDVSDNPNLNMYELRDKLSQQSSIIYAMISPRGGLKFAILTNFNQLNLKTSIDVKALYKSLHKKLSAHIQSIVGDFNNDAQTENMMQTCNISYDPDVHVNLNATPFNFDLGEINSAIAEIEDATSAHQQISKMDDNKTLDDLQEEFIHLLAGIPNNLSYTDRLPVNFTALYLFGLSGIQMMLSHWVVKDRSKLEGDLKTQMKSAKYHCMNKVRAMSSKHIKATNTIHGWSCAVPSLHVFEERISIEDARQLTHEIINDFFRDPKTTIVKAPCGIGKSTIAASILAKTHYKVLYLTPSHDLGNEIVESIRTEQRNIRKQAATIAKRKFSSHLPPTHIYGRTATNSDEVLMCENKQVFEYYNEQKVQIPNQECLKCHMMPCRYTLQFENLSNVRISTHATLINKPSNWENGTTFNQISLTENQLNNPLQTKGDIGLVEVLGPKSGDWAPNIIIVDEAFLSSGQFDLTSTVQSKSLKQILFDCSSGKELLSAIESSADQLRKDFNTLGAVEANLKNFVGEEYVENARKYSRSGSVFLKVFHDALQASTVTNDLLAMRLSRGQGETKMIYNPLLAIHERFQNVPILIFDATAQKEIYQYIYPDAKFVEISARPSSEFKVFQLQNFALSKKELRNSPSVYGEVVKDIASKIDFHEAKKVGLISYKKIGVNGEGFSFVNKLKAEVLPFLNDQSVDIKTLHFGHLRGSNFFNDCDLVIVVGRYFLHENAILGKAQQMIKCNLSELGLKEIERPSRLREHDSIAFPNYSHLSPDVQSIQDAFGLAETVQAIYRARPFTDKPKTVYYYSNASLGGDVSIDGVFDLPVGKMFDSLNNLSKVGFCQITPSELKKLGFSEYESTPVGREERIRQILSRGVSRYVFVMRQNGKDVSKDYLVTNLAKLEEHLSQAKFKIKERRQIF